MPLCQILLVSMFEMSLLLLLLLLLQSLHVGIDCKYASEFVHYCWSVGKKDYTCGQFLDVFYKVSFCSVITEI